MKELHLQPPEDKPLTEPQELRWCLEGFNLVSDDAEGFHNPREPRLDAEIHWDGEDWYFDNYGVVTFEDGCKEEVEVCVDEMHPLLDPYRKRLNKHIQDYIDDNTEDDS